MCAVCASLEVCRADQTCGIDPQSIWTVQPVSATVTTMNGTADWDLGGGAPDPYVDTWCPSDAGTPSTTPVVTNSFTPTWSTGGCSTTAKELLSKGYGVDAFDDDVGSAPDLIAGKGIIAVTEAMLRDGGDVRGNSKISIRLTFTKQ
jgi:hypothetical protein